MFLSVLSKYSEDANVCRWAVHPLAHENMLFLCFDCVKRCEEHERKDKKCKMTPLIKT